MGDAFDFASCGFFPLRIEFPALAMVLSYLIEKFSAFEAIILT